MQLKAQQHKGQQLPMPPHAEHPMVPVPEAMGVVLRETDNMMAAAAAKQHHFEVETVALPPSDWSALLHRRLHNTVMMPAPGYPPYAASIMDGYCVRSADYVGNKFAKEKRVGQVVGQVLAGDNDTPLYNQDTTENGQQPPPCYYVTTGAAMPPTFDCVVPVEEAIVTTIDQHNIITIAPDATIQPHQWVRPIGCDIAANAPVLPRGHVLDAASVGLLLQTGCPHIELCPFPRVGVVSTGNELMESQQQQQQQSGPGGCRIPDVNRPMLLQLLRSWHNCIARDYGMVRDDDGPGLRARLHEAAQHCDVVITTGGISLGVSDVVEGVLLDLGAKVHFGRLHMKPGKPTTFATLQQDKTLFFCLPGNPVSAMICCHLLVQPCLDMLYEGSTTSAHSVVQEQGIAVSPSTASSSSRHDFANALVHGEILVEITHDITLDAERPEYHRVHLQYAEAGTKILATSTGVQRSSRLLSMRGAEAMLVLPQASASCAKVLAGSKQLALLMNDRHRRIPVHLSHHLRGWIACSKPAVPALNVSLIQVGPERLDKDEMETVVASSLSGSKSGTAKVVSVLCHDGPNECDGLRRAITHTSADLVVISSTCTLKHHLELARHVRTIITKPAEAMALQIRQGSGNQTPSAALYDTAVGLVEESKAIVVLVHQSGLKGGLTNVRGLVKHALKIARE